MHSTAPHVSCQHACLWAGTVQCLVCQVSAEQLASRRLSLGMRCGLKALYDPHPLPPCIQAHGELCWEPVASCLQARVDWDD